MFAVMYILFFFFIIVCAFFTNFILNKKRNAVSVSVMLACSLTELPSRDSGC